MSWHGTGRRPQELVATKTFDAKAHAVESRRSPHKIAVLSIDLEYDYSGNESEALDRLPVFACLPGLSYTDLNAAEAQELAREMKDRAFNVRVLGDPQPSPLRGGTEAPACLAQSGHRSGRLQAVPLPCGPLSPCTLCGGRCMAPGGHFE